MWLPPPVAECRFYSTSAASLGKWDQGPMPCRAECPRPPPPSRGSRAAVRGGLSWKWQPGDAAVRQRCRQPALQLMMSGYAAARGSAGQPCSSTIHDNEPKPERHAPRQCPTSRVRIVANAFVPLIVSDRDGRLGPQIGAPGSWWRRRKEVAALSRVAGVLYGHASVLPPYVRSFRLLNAE